MKTVSRTLIALVLALAIVALTGCTANLESRIDTLTAGGLTSGQLAETIIEEEKNILNIESEFDYSYGLDDSGRYEGIGSLSIDKGNCVVFDDTIEVQQSEYLNWLVSEAQSLGSDAQTIDDVCNIYAYQYLESLGCYSKETAEENDIVAVTLTFMDADGETIDDLGGESELNAVTDGDAITSSLIGHSVDDEYTVEYVFSSEKEEDDLIEKYGESVEVTVLVTAITDGRGIEAVFEDNISLVQSVYPDVVDITSFRDALLPSVIEANIGSYAEYLMTFNTINIPVSYVTSEYARFIYRLSAVGLDESEYVENNGGLDEILAACTQNAIMNAVSMLLVDDEITQEELYEYYADDPSLESEDDNYEMYLEYQGESYMKLRILRLKAAELVESKITIIDEAEN